MIPTTTMEQHHQHLQHHYYHQQQQQQPEPPASQSLLEYRAAITLNNIGVTLLERGLHESAMRTFKDAIFVMKNVERPTVKKDVKAAAAATSATSRQQGKPSYVEIARRASLSSIKTIVMPPRMNASAERRLERAQKLLADVCQQQQEAPVVGMKRRGSLLSSLSSSSLFSSSSSASSNSSSSNSSSMSSLSSCSSTCTPVVVLSYARDLLTWSKFGKSKAAAMATTPTITPSRTQCRRNSLQYGESSHQQQQQVQVPPSPQQQQQQQQIQSRRGYFRQSRRNSCSSLSSKSAQQSPPRGAAASPKPSSASTSTTTTNKSKSALSPVRIDFWAVQDIQDSLDDPVKMDIQSSLMLLNFGIANLSLFKLMASRTREKSDSLLQTALKLFSYAHSIVEHHVTELSREMEDIQQKQQVLLDGSSSSGSSSRSGMSVSSGSSSSSLLQDVTTPYLLCLHVQTVSLYNLLEVLAEMGGDWKVAHETLQTILLAESKIREVLTDLDSAAAAAAA